MALWDVDCDEDQYETEDESVEWEDGDDAEECYQELHEAV